MGVERAASHASETVTVRSGLPAMADEARVGSDQAAVTVPLLMAQMGLLLVCVLWLVLVSAADQRRGEVAVARLRGRGSRGARRLLLGETLPPVVVGAPLGALLAVGLCTVARRTVLTSDPPFEVPVAAVVALVAGLALMVVLAVLSVRRVCRDPVADLIRSVPARRTGIRLGVLEAMLVAGAAAAFIALVTGSVQGPVGQLAPTLLALAVGVVAARVLSYLLGIGGRRLLQGGPAHRRRRPAHVEPARDDPMARPRRHRRPQHHRRLGRRAGRRRPQLGRPRRRGGGSRQRPEPELGRPRGGDGRRFGRSTPVASTSRRSPSSRPRGRAGRPPSPSSRTPSAASRCGRASRSAPSPGTG